MRDARRLRGRNNAKRRRSAGHDREIVHRRDRQCGCSQTVGCDRESTKGTRAMSQARIRQIARLQRLAQPCLKQKEQDDRKWQQTIRGAANHAAVLAFLIRYGKPRIDEPLSDACERCAQSAAWKDCCDEFKSLLVPGSEYLRLESPGPFQPHDMDGVNIIGPALRHLIISTYSGADEKQKLELAFTSAPPWLLWFTFADYTAKLLNLTIPDFQQSPDSCDPRPTLTSGGDCREAHLNAHLGHMDLKANPLHAPI